jgi:rRNA maturation RNase YbeY
VEIVLLNDRDMGAAHRLCLGREGPTDVISLAYRPAAPGEGWRGEVLINLDRARALGPRHGGEAAERALYLAHGLDHLSGAHDRTPAERARMRRRERAWLRAARAAGLAAEGDAPC